MKWQIIMRNIGANIVNIFDDLKEIIGVIIDIGVTILQNAQIILS
jgi:hypothetical protein